MQIIRGNSMYEKSLNTPPDLSFLQQLSRER